MNTIRTGTLLRIGHWVFGSGLNEIKVVIMNQRTWKYCKRVLSISNLVRNYCWTQGSNPWYQMEVYVISFIILMIFSLNYLWRGCFAVVAHVTWEQGNHSAGGSSAGSFFAPNEFDCANRIKLKVCQCVNRRSIVPSLLLYILRSSLLRCLRLYCVYHTTSLTSALKLKLMADSWVGIVKNSRLFSHELSWRRCRRCFSLSSCLRPRLRFNLNVLSDNLFMQLHLNISISLLCNAIQSRINLCRLKSSKSYKLDLKKVFNLIAIYRKYFD